MSNGINGVVCMDGQCKESGHPALQELT